MLSKTDNSPVTIILTAREQDLEKATTVLALTIKRLQSILFDRMKQPKDQLSKVVLLLDETRRIRGFDASRYVTFAREARAGCVISYQSLDQIGGESQVVEMLENVGTQIYLGSLRGNTVRFLLRTLPQRERSTISYQRTQSGGVVSKCLVYGHEVVDYFSSHDLHDLPGGEFPALVILNEHRKRKPFLVDLYDESIVD